MSGAWSLSNSIFRQLVFAFRFSLSAFPLPFLAATSALGALAEPTDFFRQQVVPLLDRHCYSCHGLVKHKGDLILDGWPSEAAAVADTKIWERVLQKLEAQEMPPPEKKQPSARERQLLVSWIEKEVLHCDCEHPDPGRVTVRRLNRAEYNNTIRDLLQVSFRPADDFPVDDSGHGFDTIGDALSLPPMLLEKYLESAHRIVDAATRTPITAVATGPITNRYAVDLLELGYNAKQRGDGWVSLNSTEEDDVAVIYHAPAAGQYVFRVRAYARQLGTNRIKLTFLRDKTPVRVVEVETNQISPHLYEASFHLAPGPHRLRAAVRRIKDGLTENEALRWKSGPTQNGAVLVQQVEVIAPPTPATRLAARLSLPRVVPGAETTTALKFLKDFAPRAYRRPLASEELMPLLDLAEAARLRCAAAPPDQASIGSASGPSVSPQECFEEGLRVALQAVLVSPHFLFRGELQADPDNPRAIRAINEPALASRLSYFLWSSMPDDELRVLAQEGKLRRRLGSQVRRMLRDPKSRALVDHFAGQWLQLRNLELATPDAEMFPTFNEGLRHAMRRETELFFEHILREDRSVFEFLTADYTFVNAALARHYGLPEPKGTGDDFHRVSLRNTPRRGLMTQGSVLLITSNPTRTSPVKRGKWVMENLLNAPPPPPPPNVPELKEGKELKGTLRERLEQHRSDPLCASCHARLDPIGFAFENFNGIGAWRTLDHGSTIDATGRLATGETFQGADELIEILARSKREQFVRCLADRMLTYALGRGLDVYDKCALDTICRNVSGQKYRFSAFIMEVVNSVPFQMRRGDGSSPGG